MLKRQARAWAKGKLKEYFDKHKNEFLFESLRLYTLSLQFHTLPVCGGIYNQDPQLLKEWRIITNEEGKVKQKVSEDLDRKQEEITRQYRGQPHSSHFPPRKSWSSGKVGGLNFKRVPKVPPVFNRYHKGK